MCSTSQCPVRRFLPANSVLCCSRFQTTGRVPPQGHVRCATRGIPAVTRGDLSCNPPMQGHASFPCTRRRSRLAATPRGVSFGGTRGIVASERGPWTLPPPGFDPARERGFRPRLNIARKNNLISNSHFSGRQACKPLSGLKSSPIRGVAPASAALAAALTNSSLEKPARSAI